MLSLYKTNGTLLYFIVRHRIFDATKNKMVFFLAYWWLPTENGELRFAKSLSSLALNWERGLSRNTPYLSINVVGWVMFDEPGRRRIIRAYFCLTRQMFLVVLCFKLCTRFELHYTKIVSFLELFFDLVLSNYSNLSLSFYFSLVIVLNNGWLTRYCFIE